MTRRIVANQEGRFQPLDDHSKRQEQELALDLYASCRFLKMLGPDSKGEKIWIFELFSDPNRHQTTIELTADSLIQNPEQRVDLKSTCLVIF